MFFMVSCEDKGTGGSGDSQAAKNKEANRNILKAIESGDSSKMSEWIAKDAVDHSGPNGQVVNGGDSIIAMLSHIKSAFSDLKFEVLEDAAEGDVVFARVRMVGTTTANPGMGMPPNQKMDMTSVDVIKFKDGKATAHWGYIDPKDAMMMMQSQPQPGTMQGPGNNQPAVKDSVKK